MSHDDRLTRHLNALAEAAVPDGLRPDPPLSARVRAGARHHVGSRRRGLATLAAALSVAVLGLVLLSRLPGEGPSSAAQGSEATRTPGAVAPLPVALMLDAEPQAIRLGGELPAVLLDLPDAPLTLTVAVAGAPTGGPVVVGYRPDARPLFSFDPALTRRLRLELSAPPGQVRLFLDPGTSGGDETLTLQVSVAGLPEDAPAGKPCPCRRGGSPWWWPTPCTGHWSPARRWTST